MIKIESDHVQVNASTQNVFTFLEDMNNFKQLLPEDKISEWTSNETSCSFKVQGMATISLIKDRAVENQSIHIKSGEKSPIPFTLDILLKDNGETTEGYNVFVGEANSFLKMMIEKPLKNLFNHVAKRLTEVEL